MTDALPRRMTDNQIRMAAAELQRDAERLAADAHRYAEDLKTGQAVDMGMAYRLAQNIADILRQSARLDGMRTISDLFNE